MDIKIDKMTVKDLESIKDILISDFDDFWNYNILKDELKSENSKYIVAKFNNKIIGFSGIKVFVDNADIMNIVVRKNFRNKEIGTVLLENLLTLSKKLGLNSLSLEVNEKNIPAINLYKKLGFENIGIRKNYYNGKNGIIMTRNLKQEI